jgi:hypothetical protein
MKTWISFLAAGVVLIAASQTSAAELPEPGFQVDHARWDPDRPARPWGKYKGPIIDTHVHLHVPKDGPNQGRFREFEEGMGGMRRLVDLGKGRASHHCGSDHLTVWMNSAIRGGYEAAELDQRLGRLEAELDGGPCTAIGEIGPYHFEKSPGQLVIHFP